MLIDFPASNAVEATAAYAASLVRGADFAGAEEVLDEVPPAHRVPIVDFVRAFLHFATQRWPDVLTSLTRSDRWNDPYMQATADYMGGSACVQLGMFAEGARRLPGRGAA